MHKIILLGTAVLLAGCAMLEPRDSNANIVTIDPKTGHPIETATTAAAMLKAFPDIPIPASHRLNLERSMIFTATAQTMGKLTTEGSGDVDTIFHFYNRQMP